jgi:hypothetical protein
LSAGSARSPADPPSAGGPALRTCSDGRVESQPGPFAGVEPSKALAGLELASWATLAGTVVTVVGSFTRWEERASAPTAGAGAGAPGDSSWSRGLDATAGDVLGAIGLVLVFVLRCGRDPSAGRPVTRRRSGPLGGPSPLRHVDTSSGRSPSCRRT